jgi:TolB protein
MRAWNDAADPLLLDLYPYATTNPVWLGQGGAVAGSQEDAKYFVAWIDRVIEAADARDDYNDEGEKRATLDYLRDARATYTRLAQGR